MSTLVNTHTTRWTSLVSVVSHCKTAGCLDAG